VPTNPERRPADCISTLRNIAPELYGESQCDCIWHLTNCGFALRRHGKLIFACPTPTTGC